MASLRARASRAVTPRPLEPSATVYRQGCASSPWGGHLSSAGGTASRVYRVYPRCDVEVPLSTLWSLGGRFGPLPDSLHRRIRCCYKDMAEERAPDRSGFWEPATDCDALEDRLTQLRPPPEAVRRCRSSRPASLGTPRPPADSTSVRQTFTCCTCTERPSAVMRQ